MPPLTLPSSPALSAIKFTPQEKHSARMGPDGLTDDQRNNRGKAMGPARILALVDRFYKKRAVTEAMSGYVPRLRERVSVEGYEGVFIVIYVDGERAVADLISTERVGDLLECVPFTAIYPADSPRAA